MTEKVEDLTVDYEDEDILTTKELDKVILSKGAWATIIFRYQNWDKAKSAYGPDRYTIRRYQKRNNAYMPKSKFNISSNDQAQKIVDALTGWLTAEASEASK